MKTETFTKQSDFPLPAKVLYDWHTRPGAFERLKPPWESLVLASADNGIEPGTRIELRVPIGPFRKRWIAEITDCQPGKQFTDTQTSGPFAFWKHTHTILPNNEHASRLVDHIEYALPCGLLGRFFGSKQIQKKLERVFAYRHKLLAHDLQSHQNAKRNSPMKVLVSGSHGLVGSALVPFLTTGGHEILKLVRNPDPSSGEVSWDPESGTIDSAQLENLDAVVHLAGENIAGRRWNAAQKQRIRDSRVNGTRSLCETLSKLEHPPKVLVSASAIGFYGDRADEELNEQSDPGTGFLADVCREWEAACEPARKKGIRVVNIRFGVILSSAGGALAKMLLPFKLGAGGIIGNGKQYWSWIALDDVLGTILHSITRDDLNGPVNCVSPTPATNHDFTKTLGKVLKRPTLFPLPAFAARLALGEMANDLLISSARVLPKELQKTNYQFRFEDLETALRHTLGKLRENWPLSLRLR